MNPALFWTVALTKLFCLFCRQTQITGKVVNISLCYWVWFRWGTTRFKCRIAINMSTSCCPRFQTESELSSLSQIFRRLWYKEFFFVWDRPHCSWQIWIFHCGLGFRDDPRNNRLNDLLVPSKHGNGERHLMRTINTSCEKHNTRSTTNMGVPTFVWVIHFTPKN